MEEAEDAVMEPDALPELDAPEPQSSGDAVDDLPDLELAPAPGEESDPQGAPE